VAWILLLIAGLLEVGWAIGLKYTEGFTKVWPSVFTLTAMTASVVLLDSLTRLNLHRLSQLFLRRNVGLVAPRIDGIVGGMEPAQGLR
jgi:quaternary ammonium compound-resistance protein SugE